jgi:hypothetical protein
MSKTYKKTNKGRKIDWIANHHRALKKRTYLRYFSSANELPDTIEELEKLLANTIVYKQEITSTYENFEHTYSVWINAYLKERIQKKLDALIWIKNNPHRYQDEDDYFMFHYSKNPSWWNKEFHTVPCRAKEKQLLNKIKKGDIDSEDTIWPTNKKPTKYYW